jgi:hypothetical protein
MMMWHRMMVVEVDRGHGIRLFDLDSLELVEYGVGLYSLHILRLATSIRIGTVLSCPYSESQSQARIWSSVYSTYLNSLKY